MGIRNFTKFMNEAIKNGFAERNVTTNDVPQVLMIDTISSFYGILKQWQNEDGVIVEYEKAAEAAFNKLIMHVPYEKLTQMDEIFIAIDIEAPMTKEKIQFKRRQADEKYVTYTDRLFFYEAFVKHVTNVMRNFDLRVTFAKNLEDKNYRSSEGYETGEGEYIVFDYVRACIDGKGLKQFLVIGNDNDIPLLAMVFNTIYRTNDVCIRYMNTRNTNDENTVAFVCFNSKNLIFILFRLFVLGNDYIPNIVSGTEMQISKLCVINFDEMNNIFEHFIDSIFNMNSVKDQKTETTSIQYIESFSFIIYEALKAITQISLKIDHQHLNTVTDEDLKHVNGFVTACMWYFFYVINLFDSNKSEMYQNFGTRILHEKSIKINSSVFLEAMNINGGSGLKFHIDKLYTNGVLKQVIKTTLTTMFDSIY